ncbi:sphingosine N-acyltransferase lag1 [Recurvomyces mirabilis]|nr:sphingosine N-acyltransferase lag1 [Recurvomyces mirabilis]
MSSNSKTEPFPAAVPQSSMARKTSAQNVPRRRRKSSTLGADPRGDTGAGAIATNLPPHESDGSPTSSVERKANEKQPRERKRKKALKLLRRWRRMSRRHTWLNPLILIIVVLSAYFISPGEQNLLHPFLYLSYADPPLEERTNTLPAHIGDVTQYGKGTQDLKFVGFYIIVFTFTREFVMQRFIKPQGIYFGIGRSKMARFLEQYYTALYFVIFGPFGLFVMSRTPVWYFNTTGMYEGYPHRAHEAWFKAYYLLQAAYWSQQAIVLMLQLEKPRGDFKELVLHHIVTLALIGLSYRFHFTYMGVAVYVTHDISDFFLATSKTLNYLDLWLTSPFFAVFVFVWAYLRHYVNLVILKSLLPPATYTIPFTSLTVQTGEFATVGPYTLDFATQQYKCWISQPMVFLLLAALQCINIFWFFLILRILWRILVTSKLSDVRSDDEGGEVEEEEEEDDVVTKSSAIEEKKKAAGLGSGNGHAKTPTLAVNGRPISPVAE